MIFVSSPKYWEGRLPTKSSRLVSTLVVLSVMSVSLFAQQISPRTEEYIQREVRHELLMLPYLTVFDNLTYRVDGYTVTLMGQVTDPVVKSDAGNTVKQIEGVEKVVNQIEVLPLSPMDQQLRLRVYRAIYDYPALQRYALPVIEPIRIVVKNGHVTLEGIVDSEGDKNIAGLRASGVPGIFSVTNNLAVAQPK